MGRRSQALNASDSLLSVHLTRTLSMPSTFLGCRIFPRGTKGHAPAGRGEAAAAAVGVPLILNCFHSPAVAHILESHGGGDLIVDQGAGGGGGGPAGAGGSVAGSPSSIARAVSAANVLDAPDDDDEAERDENGHPIAPPLRPRRRWRVVAGGLDDTNNATQPGRRKGGGGGGKGGAASGSKCWIFSRSAPRTFAVGDADVLAALKLRGMLNSAHLTALFESDAHARTKAELLERKQRAKDRAHHLHALDESDDGGSATDGSAASGAAAYAAGGGRQTVHHQISGTIGAIAGGDGSARRLSSVVTKEKLEHAKHKIKQAHTAAQAVAMMGNDLGAETTLPLAAVRLHVYVRASGGDARRQQGQQGRRGGAAGGGEWRRLRRPVKMRRVYDVGPEGAPGAARRRRRYVFQTRSVIEHFNVHIAHVSRSYFRSIDRFIYHLPGGGTTTSTAAAPAATAATATVATATASPTTTAKPRAPCATRARSCARRARFATTTRPPSWTTTASRSDTRNPCASWRPARMNCGYHCLFPTVKYGDTRVWG